MVSYLSSQALREAITASDKTLFAAFEQLCHRLGFGPTHLSHNRQLLTKVAELNHLLAAGGAGPSADELLGVDLYGYQKDVEWLFTPYYRDFRIEPGHALEPGQIVKFGLIVSKHPTDDRLVLNAVNLSPATR